MSAAAQGSGGTARGGASRAGGARALGWGAGGGGGCNFGGGEAGPGNLGWSGKELGGWEVWREPARGGIPSAVSFGRARSFADLGKKVGSGDWKGWEGEGGVTDGGKTRKGSA